MSASTGSSSLKQHPVDSASSKSSDSQSDNNLSADDEIEQDTSKFEIDRTYVIYVTLL